MSQLFTSGDQSFGASTSVQWVFRVYFLWDQMVWCPCSPRDSQESSPAPQFESINSSMLSLLYGPIFTYVHDYWKKKHSFDYMDIAKKWCLCFLICCLGVYYFPSKEQRSFSFIDSVTICNAFGAQEKKICHCFQFFLFYLLWSDRTGSHDLSFINVEFQARLFTLLFHPHQEAL